MSSQKCPSRIRKAQDSLSNYLSQKSHLQILPYWALEFQHANFGETDIQHIASALEKKKEKEN